ncbi:hypothetical protein NLI96_g1812 [Meripilus lineatus]|uniref:Cytochrome P450 n=1 Tax=Meripilus lineatus TaxID=2056292 RepID=A0AAD5VA26_9APHY|nr:hypothetical protein NLI96_g1812 [Physisporinus lineatus]
MTPPAAFLLIIGSFRIGWGDMLTFLNTGDSFNKARKLLQDPFTQSKCTMFQDMQLGMTHVLLKHLLSDPKEFDAHLKRYSTAVIIEIAYGHKIISDDDKYLELTEANGHYLAVGGDWGTTPVDLLPVLRYLPAWFPGAWFIQHARDAGAVATALRDYPFEEVLRKLANGTACKSFTTIGLEALKNENQDSDEDMFRLRNAAGAMYSAGSDTTWATLTTFVLLMVLNPEKQRKAQKELDAVLGVGRLPNFSDRDSLPYLECVLWETMRWHPVVPLGVPHRLSEDDIYRGYHIPRNSTIIANTRCITMDESVYRNPSEFSPERFLPYPEGRDEPRTNAVFGYGRRVCPGRYLGEANVWIAIANLLTAFNFSPIKDADGVERLPKAEFYDSFVGETVAQMPSKGYEF